MLIVVPVAEKPRVSQLADRRRSHWPALRLVGRAEHALQRGSKRVGTVCTPQRVIGFLLWRALKSAFRQSRAGDHDCVGDPTLAGRMRHLQARLPHGVHSLSATTNRRLLCEWDRLRLNCAKRPERMYRRRLRVDCADAA